MWLSWISYSSKWLKPILANYFHLAPNQLGNQAFKWKVMCLLAQSLRTVPAPDDTSAQSIPPPKLPCLWHTAAGAHAALVHHPGAQNGSRLTRFSEHLRASGFHLPAGTKTKIIINSPSSSEGKCSHSCQQHEGEKDQTHRVRNDISILQKNQKRNVCT